MRLIEISNTIDILAIPVLCSPFPYYGATSQPSLNYSSDVYHAVDTSFDSVSTESTADNYTRILIREPFSSYIVPHLPRVR